jgi:hypothetical protein
MNAYEVFNDAQEEWGANGTALQRSIAFYRVQSRYTLLDKPAEISFNITQTLAASSSWKGAIMRAVKIVNFHVPGLHIFQTQQSFDYKHIDFVHGTDSDDHSSAYCQGSVPKHSTAKITLGKNWSHKHRNGTVLHELLHALGVEHEHKRHDRSAFGVIVNTNLNSNSQYQEADPGKYLGLTPYDPHSIMNYVNCDTKGGGGGKAFTITGPNSKSVYWANSAMTGSSRLTVLSPLDKLGLNLLWPPATRSTYKPRKSDACRLWYCGRIGATDGHNYPGSNQTDGRCGPTNGANCFACRVLRNSDLPRANCISQRVWQGSSGEFYCNKPSKKQGHGHDAVCGPNNGPSCAWCSSLNG